MVVVPEELCWRVRPAMLSLEPCWGSRSRLEQNCSTWAVWPPGDSWQAPGMCLTPGEGGGGQGYCSASCSVLAQVSLVLRPEPRLDDYQVTGGLAGVGGSPLHLTALGPWLPAERWEGLGGPKFLLSWTG